MPTPSDESEPAVAQQPSLHIGLCLSPTWLRGSAWRRADSRVEESFSSDFYLDVAQMAESARLDFVFKPDTLFLDSSVLADWPGLATLDPTVLLASLARETTRIGLVSTASTAFDHPYQVARRLQSLDAVSHGRAGWNVVTALGGHENFGLDEMPTSPQRYARAQEFVDVVQELWRSFPRQALVMDRASGRFADTTRLRPIAHRGEHFAVAGPLDVPAHERGRLPIVQAGDSAAGRDLAARVADAVFAATPQTADGVSLRQELRRRAVWHGRDPGAVRVLPGLSMFLASSADQARLLHAESAALSRHPRGAPHWTVVGTADDVVASVLDRVEAGAADGFIALPGGSWESLAIFTQEVVPRLVDRGAFREEYSGSTLADHLGVGA